MLRILLIDDDADFVAATETLLARQQHTVETAGSVADAEALLSNHAFDLILADIALPDGSGLELIRDSGPPAIVITGHPSVETAIRAVKGPVVDYLIKPLDKPTLFKAVNTVANLGRGRSVADGSAVQHIAGESAGMRRVRQSILDYGPLDETVLIIGESGTGKELVARALHNARTSKEPLVTVNCGAISPELIASELFGHEKGAFTGAQTMRQGVFEAAGKGTVFLDEVGELPLQQQVSLLRVLESRAVTRVGSNNSRPVEARVVAATNQHLEKMVRSGDFREDLYFRLMVLRIDVPPLREREGDIGLLSRILLEQTAEEHGTPRELDPDLLPRLDAYDWPGNVRELKHVMLRAALDCRDQPVVNRLPGDFGRPLLLGDDPDSIRPGMAIRDVERILISKTLKHFDGNRKDTAEALGVSLKTLYNRLRYYSDRGIDFDP